MKKKAPPKTLRPAVVSIFDQDDDLFIDLPETFPEPTAQDARDAMRMIHGFPTGTRTDHTDLL